MDAAVVGVTEEEDEEQGIDQQDIFDRMVLLVLIRYYFDYEWARIWQSGVLETSRHDRSVQRPCTCTLRINTPGSSVEFHRNKKS